jgi:proteasome accessory factor B
LIEPRGPILGRHEAGGACGRAQLARLFRLVLMLQAERYPNARELAERNEVSRRTIYRDLDLLAEAGIPVRYRPERQGYQLAKGFFLPPTSLDESEALALLVLARQGQWGDGLGLSRHAWGGAMKLVQGLPAEVRERVLAAAEPFRTEPSRPGPAPERQQVHDAILSSLTQLRQLRLWYRPSNSGPDECTKFSLYQLVLHDRHWFMVGRSSLHRRVEVIGVPWVRKVVLTEDRYTIPPRFSLERFLGLAWGVRRDPVRQRVWLRFSAAVAPELNDVVWHRSQRRAVLADGRVDLQFVVDGIEEVTRWLLGFGDQVEVLEPPALRRRVFEVAAGVARRHRPARREPGPAVSD